MSDHDLVYYMLGVVITNFFTGLVFIWAITTLRARVRMLERRFARSRCAKSQEVEDADVVIRHVMEHVSMRNRQGYNALDGLTAEEFANRLRRVR